MEQEVLCRLALIQIPGIGDLFAKLLTEYFKGAKYLFTSSRKELALIPGVGTYLLGNLTSTKIKNEVFLRAEQELRFTEKYNIKIILYDQLGYPEKLKGIDDAPFILFYKGTDVLQTTKILSLVGTRKATGYGEDVTRKITEDLKDENILIVSGLAYGIDTFAHKFAIENELPTLGVLAHGLDRIYPHKNKGLAEKMVENGGLLTEFFSGTNPDRENFPKRNRIVAGISDATVVIEATVKGGALITARIANSYSRDVLAVPGRTIDFYSKGCNWIIKNEQAALIESGQDILKALNWTEAPEVFENKNQLELFLNLSNDEKAILDVLKNNGTANKERLAVQLNQKLSVLSGMLFNMEMNGIIKALPGNNYQLKA
jgi:DNA processing protein